MSDIAIEDAARWLPAGLDLLRCEADDEGIRIVSTVIDRWIDGTQLYDRPGEKLLVGRVGERIVAVGGLALCPNVAGALRVRRFYVSPTARRRDVAHDLARQLISTSAEYTSVVTCNARASDAAAPFWESLGFLPVDADGITHRLDLTSV